MGLVHFSSLGLVHFSCLGLVHFNSLVLVHFNSLGLVHLNEMRICVRCCTGRLETHRGLHFFLVVDQTF